MESLNKPTEERSDKNRGTKGFQSIPEFKERRRASKELSRSGALARQLDKRHSLEIAQLLQAIFEHAPAAISVRDTRGRFLVVNGKFESLYQMQRDRIEDETDHNVLSGCEADSLRSNELEVLATGQSFESEAVISNSKESGGDRTFQCLKFPIAGPDGCPYAVGGISTDVTDRKRVERCLVIQHAVTRALVDAAVSFDTEPAILAALCTNLAWDVGLLWRVDQNAGVLRCAEVWHPPSVAVPAFEQMSRGMTLTSGVGLPGRVWESGQPIWIEDVVRAENFPRAAAALEEDMHGALAFPIQNGGNVLGVIEFFSREIQHRDPDLLQVMAGIGSQIAHFIEQRRAEQAVLERSREFELARRIQLGLLPKFPPLIPSFAIDGASRPAQETGGDYLDFIPMPGGSLGIAIGDASGHGIGAALVMAETRAYLRARAATDSDVGQLLTLVNRQLTEDWPENHFVTLFLARLDGPTRTLTYSGAGHWPGYILGPSGEVRHVLGSTNIPLGLDSTAEYPVAPSVILEPGDLVLLLTDGILEACSPHGQLFGVERALDTVRACRYDTPGEIVEALLHAVHQFSSEEQTDDMTAIVVKVFASQAPKSDLLCD
jgi:PAS domain S-box-containing protein